MWEDLDEDDEKEDDALNGDDNDSCEDEGCGGFIGVELSWPKYPFVDVLKLSLMNLPLANP